MLHAIKKCNLTLSDEIKKAFFLSGKIFEEQNIQKIKFLFIFAAFFVLASFRREQAKRSCITIIF
jgi:hypothetical protein